MSKQLPMATDGKYQPNERIVAWWKSNNLTMSKIAKRSGFHEGTISKYLAGTYPTEVTEIEKTLLDIIDSDSRKSSWERFYFDTEASKATVETIELTRSSCYISLITGAAGVGKSTATRKYAESNKSSIFVELSEGLGDNHSIIRMLFDSLDIRLWKKEKGGITRGEYLIKRLTGSERIVLVDNAQRATLPGLRWLFDLNDKAGIPIALIGNPEVSEKISGSDQLSSRVRFRVNVGGTSKKELAWLDDATESMLSKMWPDHPKEILIVAQETARQSGHLRLLESQIRIGLLLCKSPKWRDKPSQAFITARMMVGKEDWE